MAGAIAIGVCIALILLLLWLIFGQPDGQWMYRPRGGYAYLWALLATSVVILIGLFIAGCAQLYEPHDRTVTINRPSVVWTMFGGMMALAGAGRVLMLLAAAVGLFSNADMNSLADAERAEKQKAVARMQEHEAARRAAVQAEADRAGRDLVESFASGATWSVEVLPHTTKLPRKPRRLPRRR